MRGLPLVLASFAGIAIAVAALIHGAFTRGATLPVRTMLPMAEKDTDAQSVPQPSPSQPGVSPSPGGGGGITPFPPGVTVTPSPSISPVRSPRPVSCSSSS